jgi:hypothetical protein
MTQYLLGLTWISGSVLGIVIIKMLRANHLSMNSRLDELLMTTKKLARAEGFTAGQKDHLDAVRAAGSKLDAK